MRFVPPRTTVQADELGPRRRLHPKAPAPPSGGPSAGAYGYQGDTTRAQQQRRDDVAVRNASQQQLRDYVAGVINPMPDSKWSD
jgi:hypothetical protein